VQRQTGVGIELEDLIAKYGEENGRYLFEELNKYKQQYRGLTFIETGLEPDGRFEEDARAEAAEKGWEYAKIPGDLSLFRQLIGGEWDDRDFLVVEPGWRIVARYDEAVMGIERV
jgi:hypothetical protein